MLGNQNTLGDAIQISEKIGDILNKCYGLGLWCVTPLSTIFQLYRLYRGGGGNQSVTDLSQVTDKLDHIMLYRVHLAMNGVRAYSFIGDNCIASCKSNCHTITTTKTPGNIEEKIPSKDK